MVIIPPPSQSLKRRIHHGPVHNAEPTGQSLEDAVGTAGHRKIADLQILRGIAILMVLAQHLSLTSALKDSLPIKVTLPFYVGVEIFFVISGYIIMTILMRDGYHAPRFLLKRAFRLLPAIFVFVALSAVINLLFRTLPLPDHWVAVHSVDADSFVRQAFGVVGGYFLLLGESSYLNGAIWSLSVEDQFYGALALAVAVGGLLCRWQKNSIERFVGILAGAVLITVLAARFAILAKASTGIAAIQPIAYLTKFKFDFIAAGILIAFLDRRIGQKIRAKFAISGPVVCAYAMCGILGILAVCESPFAADTHHLDGLGLPLVCMGSCFIVLLAGNGVAFPRTNSLMQRTMERLGDRSYTYYLFHYPVFAISWLLFYFAAPWALKGTKTSGVMQLVMTVVLLIPLAEFIYRYVETTAIRRGRELVDRWFPVASRREIV